MISWLLTKSINLSYLSVRLNPPCTLRLYGEKEFGYLTAEALRSRSKEFLIKITSELCELRASVVKFSSLFRLGFAASIFTHDDAMFGMGCRAYRLAGLESLGWRRDDA